MTPMISFALPAPFRKEQAVNDLCGRGQGSAHVVVLEQANWWSVSKACCVCVYENRNLRVMVFRNEGKKQPRNRLQPTTGVLLG